MSCAPTDFIRTLIEEDLHSGRHTEVVTRFPPEPNGYLHIGHAKSICLNFGVAAQYHGKCHLRFDDTNPAKEDVAFEESIKCDLRWLGFDWGEYLFHASDYFEQFYEAAVHLINQGHAYVCRLTEEEMRAQRGTVTTVGVCSPDRDRPLEESLSLLEQMRNGDFPDGRYTLRAKIDMSAANMKMRDPPLYRIRNVPHERTGTRWHIYPMYDFAHCISDAIEGITHSLCTLEFENNRELYDWILAHLCFDKRPKQTEFARLNLSYTVLSKRKLSQLVADKKVTGWDDPRMPTLAGLRRRGYTPESIRAFCGQIGVAKSNSTVDMAQLEFNIRNDLNHKAPRVLAVLDPLKVVIENYPENTTEDFEAPYFPHDIPKEGSRKVPFGRELYIERSDFMEQPPKHYHRLAPGREVRLRYAYFIKCEKVIKNKTGDIIELRCRYDPATQGGKAKDGRKVKGTIHWVSAPHAIDAEVRVYDRLFEEISPGAAGTEYTQCINTDSLKVLHAQLEPSLKNAKAGEHFQFERMGYFFVDPKASKDAATLVFNKTVGLRDSWSKGAHAQKSLGATGKTATQSKPKLKSTNVSETQTSPSKLKTKRLLELDADRLRVAERYMAEYGLSRAQSVMIAQSKGVSELFEDAVVTHDNPKSIAKWVTHELMHELKHRKIEELPFGGQALGQLVALVDDRFISGRAAKDVFGVLRRDGGHPKDIAKTLGLEQVDDVFVLESMIDQLIADNTESVERYRSGNNKVFGFFVGQVIEKTGGKANPVLVTKLLRIRLDGATSSSH